jgi:hypothetical protein
MLHAFLLWFVAMLAFMSVLVGVGVAVFSWQLTRRNRVVRGVETAAPIAWLWAPTQPARLHRRLRTAVAPVPRPHTDDSPMSDLSKTLTSQAVTIDRDLVFVSRLPRSQRRPQLRRLRPQVSEVEVLSARLVHHHRRTTGLNAGVPQPTQAPAEVLADLGYRLDLLDRAHDELQAIEQANGLHDPEMILNRIAPVEPAPRLRRPPTKN